MKGRRRKRGEEEHKREKDNKLIDDPFSVDSKAWDVEVKNLTNNKAPQQTTGLHKTRRTKNTLHFSQVPMTSAGKRHIPDAEQETGPLVSEGIRPPSGVWVLAPLEAAGELPLGEGAEAWQTAEEVGVAMALLEEKASAVGASVHIEPSIHPEVLRAVEPLEVAGA